jgi:ubiquitin thioesterase protein OTUB1
MAIVSTDVRIHPYAIFSDVPMRHSAALAFALIERIMRSHDPSFAVANTLSILESTLSMLDDAGFQRMVFEDFYECFHDVIQNVDLPDSNGNLLTEDLLLRYIQDPQCTFRQFNVWGITSLMLLTVSNSIVVYLRLLTSAQIRTHPDEYVPYLANPDLPGSDELMPPRQFCEKFVEATGVEAGWSADLNCACGDSGF